MTDQAPRLAREPGACDVADLLRGLQDPAAYPHPVARVRVVTTHISWVVLAGGYAYKVKRPVDLGFVDYSTLERRRHFCEEEVRLNRRLTHELYLGVVPIVARGSGVRIGGDGSPVEFAVRMRRLPESRMLGRLVASNRVATEQIEELGRLLARFHRAAEPAAPTDPGGAATVRHNTEENFRQIHPFVDATISPERLDLLRDYTRAFLLEHHDLFERRRAQGWVRDGHGDLRCDNVCVTDPIQVFDCIEFNRRFRVGDVASEVAFLAMDLDARDRPDLMRSFVRAYASAFPDPDLSRLLPFYACYRAVVRGKVGSLRLRQPDLAPSSRPAIARQARRYFELAERYAKRGVSWLDEPTTLP